MCLWFPVYPWVGLLIVVRLLRSALECHYARLWYLAVSTGTVCPVAKGKVTNTTQLQVHRRYSRNQDISYFSLHAGHTIPVLTAKYHKRA